jgi:hypothetical protein
MPWPGAGRNGRINFRCMRWGAARPPCWSRPDCRRRCRIRPIVRACWPCPRCRSVAGQHFLIFRGQGGRELLRETLQARGAKVTVMELYRRELPTAAAMQWQTLSATLSHPHPRVIILTSPDALRHWQQVAGPDAQRWHWLVVSPRMHALAEVAGGRRLRWRPVPIRPACCAHCNRCGNSWSFK